MFQPVNVFDAFTYLFSGSRADPPYVNGTSSIVSPAGSSPPFPSKCTV